MPPLQPMYGPMRRAAACLATSSAPPRPALPYAVLGSVPYARALALQNALVARRLAEEDRSQPPIGDVVLLLEHPHVYTGGRRIRGEDATEGARLRALGADYFEVERGGQVTYHGPGQLVGYPILQLKDYGLTTREYVRALERAMIKICARFGVEAGTTENIGVWVGEEKIAAIGVQAQRGVTAHGFAINCDTDLGWFGHIVPCGLPDKGVTSLTKECARSAELAARDGTVSVGKVLPLAVEILGDELGRRMVSVEEAAPDLAAFIARNLGRPFASAAPARKQQGEMSAGAN
ncbi:hypothetical protein DFJ74DRAFT_736579 [Hyaloraphidium curvatum]|nr:hypothetical protein DFJ74DRAFT_736579 [Hyaloraphidium curvatum]